MCCDPAAGPEGNLQCWTGPFTFERCCNLVPRAEKQADTEDCFKTNFDLRKDLIAEQKKIRDYDRVLRQRNEKIEEQDAHLANCSSDVQNLTWSLSMVEAGTQNVTRFLADCETRCVRNTEEVESLDKRLQDFEEKKIRHAIGRGDGGNTAQAPVIGSTIHQHANGIIGLSRQAHKSLRGAQSGIILINMSKKFKFFYGR